MALAAWLMAHDALPICAYGGGGLLLALGQGVSLCQLLDAIARPFGLGGAEAAFTSAVGEPNDLAMVWRLLPTFAVALYRAWCPRQLVLASVYRLIAAAILCTHVLLGYLPSACLVFSMIDAVGACWTAAYVDYAARAIFLERESEGGLKTAAVAAAAGPVTSHPTSPCKDREVDKPFGAVRHARMPLGLSSLPAAVRRPLQHLWQRLGSQPLGSFDPTVQYSTWLFVPVGLSLTALIVAAWSVTAWTTVRFSVFAWALSTHAFLVVSMLGLDYLPLAAGFGVAHNGLEVATALAVLIAAAKNVWLSSAAAAAATSSTRSADTNFQSWTAATPYPAFSEPAVATVVALASFVAVAIQLPPVVHASSAAFRLRLAYFLSITVHYPTMAIAGVAALCCCLQTVATPASALRDERWQASQAGIAVFVLFPLHVAYELGTVAVKQIRGKPLPRAACVLYSLQVLASAAALSCVESAL